MQLYRDGVLKMNVSVCLSVCLFGKQEVIHLPGPEFNHKFALEAWGAAPRGGMLSILAAIGLIEMISNK